MFSPLTGVTKKLVIVKAYKKLDEVVQEQIITGFDSYKKLVNPPGTFEHPLPNCIGGLAHYKFQKNASGLVENSEQTYLAKLHNVRIHGENPAIITDDNYLIYDLISPYMQVHPPLHFLCNSIEFKKCKVLKGVSLSIAAPDSAGNYFHWMTDALAKIEIATKGGLSLSNVDHFIVSNNTCQYQKQTLKWLSIPTSKTISLTDNNYLYCQDLYVTSPTNYAGNISHWIIDYLRKIFAPVVLEYSGSNKCIFISRKNVAKRKLVNEDILLNQLKHLNFVEVTPENLTIEQQVAIFNNADIIIGAHGAGLTNIIFCKPGTKILEIFSPNYINQSYYTIAESANLNYNYVVCDGVDNTTKTNHLVEGDYSISKEKINSILNFVRQIN